MIFAFVQADTNGDFDPGVLLSAQTITSETTSTTTTTHITKVSSPADASMHQVERWCSAEATLLLLVFLFLFSVFHFHDWTSSALSKPSRSMFLCVCGGIMPLQHQTVKGGISETRIEKRIVISGDADIDHDQVAYSFSVLLAFLLILACDFRKWMRELNMKTLKYWQTGPQPF